MSGGESLTEMLLSTTSAADTRNQKATLLFQNIACVLDDAISGNCLPQHLQKPFREFIADLNSVAHRHFECHVRGTPRPPAPYSANTVQTQARQPIHNQAVQGVSGVTPAAPAHQQPRSFAKAATAASKQQFEQQLQQPPKQPKPSHQRPTREDNRLLVRVTQGHPALSMSPYAVMLYLNDFPKEKLVREVQITKTGFAICPASVTAQEALISKMDALESFLSTQGVCKIEKPTNHAAYLLSGIPRSYTGFNGASIESIPITASTVVEALTDLTNIEPINVFEPRGSTTAQFSHNKD